MKKIGKKSGSGMDTSRLFEWIRSKLNATTDDQKTRKREKRWVELNSVGIFGGHR